MGIPVNTYGSLCSLCYDLRLAYAPQSEVAFFTSFIDQNPGRVLEAMSGSGRLLIPMLQRGYTVDGADYSPSMLARCKTRCAQLHLAPELYEQSLENISLPHQYATVIIAIGSFQLICDRAKALQALKKLHAHMHENATLLIDIFMPATTDDSSSVSMIPVNNNTQLRMTKKYTFDHRSHIASALCTYESIVDGAIEKTEEEILQVIWYTDEQWTELLAQAGFKIIEIYDNPFGQDETSRVIYAQKI